MKNRFHGVFALILMFCALSVADYVILKNNIIFGVVYAALIPIMFFIIVNFFCRKCPHILDDSCRHVIFGKIANFLGRKKIEKYTPLELILAVIPLFVILFYPIYWLIKDIVFLVIFIVIFVIAGLEILFFVCKGCNNKNCPNCPNK